MVPTMLPWTTTRDKRIAQLVATPSPLCTSTQYNHEHYKIAIMLRGLVERRPKNAQTVWIMTLLTEALNELHRLDDPTSSPMESRKEDNRRWTDIMVRRIIAEHLLDDDESGSVTFYDCYEALREGRTRAAQARLCEQVRQSWERITGADPSTAFNLTA